MMYQAHAHIEYWAYAVAYATYVYNHTPLRAIKGITPIEALTGTTPDLSKIKVWGSDTYRVLPDHQRTKFQPTAQLGALIGYSEQQHGYMVMSPDSDHVYVTRDVNIDESSYTVMTKLTGLGGQVDMYTYHGDDAIVTLDTQDDAPPQTTVGTDPIASTKPDHQFEIGMDIEQSAPLDSVSKDDESTESTDADPPEQEEEKQTDTNNTYTPVVNEYRTRSGRLSIPVSSYGHMSIRDMDMASQKQVQNLYALSNDYIMPTTYEQAMNDEFSDKWKLACDIEIASMSDKEVYTLVPRTKHMSIVPCRWVFDIKRDENNLPIRFKARLVGKGFKQIYGIDYEETFSPVAKYKSIKMVLAFAAQHQLPLYQIDYVTAFLNAKLDKPIYMAQPDGYTIGTKQMTQVWKLNKAIYGLKQAGRAWNIELHNKLISIGYTQLAVDPCIYYKRIAGYPPIILCLYVDDTIVACHDNILSTWLNDKRQISDTYPIKDMGVCKWVLNMAVERSEDGTHISISQRRYVHNMLDKYMNVECKPASTPHLSDHIFDPSKQDGHTTELLSNEQHMLYRSIVGALLYAANTTRVDIALVVNQLARYVSKPCQHHMTAAKHVLRYLKGTMDSKLTFKQQQNTTTTATTTDDKPYMPGEIVIYTDASWGELSIDGRRSKTGVLVQVYGSTTHWISKVQTCTALSSCESEYIALAAGIQEAVWCQHWMSELLDKQIKVTVHVDNQAAISTALNDHSHERTKHIDIRLHFIRDVVRSGLVQLKYIPTDMQLADCLTKPLERVKLEHFRTLLFS
jgi:hypothetical protein